MALLVGSDASSGMADIFLLILYPAWKELVRSLLVASLSILTVFWGRGRRFVAYDLLSKAASC